MRERLDALAQRYELIGDVRGRGQLTGIELVRTTPAANRLPSKAARSVASAFQNGVISSLCRNGSVLHFVPPASTAEAQIEQFARAGDRQHHRQPARCSLAGLIKKPHVPASP